MSATTEPAERISSASAAAVVTAHLPLNSGVRLPRNAPMPSRASSDTNAFAKRLLLGRDALVEVALVRDLLDLLERERRLAGELARPRERRVEQLVVGHDRG